MHSSFNVTAGWICKGLAVAFMFTSVREIVSGNDLAALYSIGISIMLELQAVPTQIASAIKRSQSKLNQYGEHS
jgi:hypothetical protein